MRVTIIFEYADMRPWSGAGPWAAALGAALVARGHEVQVLADGTSEPRAFAAAGVPLRLRAPGRRSIESRPLVFRRWVARELAAGRATATLSLTHLCHGDVWLPMDRCMREHWGHVTASGRMISTAMQTVTRPWLVSMPAAHARARRGGVLPGRIGPVGKLGPIGSQGPVFPAAGLLTRPDAGARAGLRERCRAMLGVVPTERLVIATALHSGAAAFRAAIVAAGACGVWLRIAVIDGRPHRIARLAARLGAGSVVMPLSTTRRLDVLLCGGDAALVGDDGGGGPTSLVQADRLAVEALRFGVPVLCGAGSVAERLGVTPVMDWAAAFAAIALRDVGDGGADPWPLAALVDAVERGLRGAAAGDAKAR